MKTCPKCCKEFPQSNFYKDRVRSDGLSRICKPCSNNKTKKYYTNNREKVRAKRRIYEMRYYYGMEFEHYQKLSDKQNGVCAICGGNPENWLAIDHDHKTGQIRGLLCRTCNSALGLFKDDPTVLDKAAQYLRTI